MTPAGQNKHGKEGAQILAYLYWQRAYKEIGNGSSLSTGHFKGADYLMPSKIHGTANKKTVPFDTPSRISDIHVS